MFYLFIFLNFELILHERNGGSLIIELYRDKVFRLFCDRQYHRLYIISLEFENTIALYV